MRLSFDKLRMTGDWLTMTGAVLRQAQDDEGAM